MQIYHINCNYCHTNAAITCPHTAAALLGYANAHRGEPNPVYVSVPVGAVPRDVAKRILQPVPVAYRGHVGNVFLSAARRGRRLAGVLIAEARHELARLESWHKRTGNEAAANAYRVAVDLTDAHGDALAAWAIDRAIRGTNA